MFSRRKTPPVPDLTPQQDTAQDWGAAIGEIEIFRAGTHRTMSGTDFTFTAADVEEIANAFDPATGPVPVVIGHPKTDNPAYAWLDQVFADGDTLYATLESVDPDFAQIVKAGRYKRISSAFYASDSPNNPAPGQYYLRHVGFLGAAAPAVKGLKPVEFTGKDDDWLAFSDISGAALTAQYAHKIRQMEAERDIENLVVSGKVLPCHKDDLLLFMASLDDTNMIAFADGNDTQTLGQWFRNYIAKSPEVVPFGKYPMGSHPDRSTQLQFAAPTGFVVDKHSLDLHAKATQVMREKNVRFEEALEMIHGD